MRSSVSGAGLSRRRLLIGGVTAAGTLPFAQFSPFAFAQNGVSGGQLFEDVLTYYQFGHHRTGSATNLSTVNWISERLSNSGLRVSVPNWQLRYFDLSKHTLEINGDELESFPLWFPKVTPEQGISAPLAVFDPEGTGDPIEGRIALVPVRSLEVHDQSLHVRRINEVAVRGAKGAIICNPNIGRDQGEHLTHDVPAPYSERPWPIPVMSIAAKNYSAVHAAALEGQTAQMTLTGQTKDHAQALNVIGEIDRGGPKIIISTAFSGWLSCAGERGGPVSIFLALADWVARNTSKGSYVFVAHSGAELGYRGRKSFVETLAPAPGQAICWVELGGCTATWRWQFSDRGLVRDASHGGIENLVVSRNLMPHVKPAFRSLPGVRPRSHSAAGEIREIFQNGYSAVGLYGSNYYAHAHGDDPKNTHPELLQGVTAAIMNAITALETSIA